MQMLLNKQILITERQERAWSQTQLAEVSGLSLRTVQRIEKNGKASLESVKALASVYALKITDLRAKNSEEMQLEDPQTVAVSFSFLSPSAKVMTATLFILSTLFFWFMILTNISPAWISELRNAIFSQQLSASKLNLISASILALITLTASTCLGLSWDAIRGKGFYFYIKSGIQSGSFSVRKFYMYVHKVFLRYCRFIAKPLIISGIIILISAAGIYLTMEDYQKNNMARFLQKI